MEQNPAPEPTHFGEVEELLVRLIILRRNPRYRAALVEGTGLDGRVTTMRTVRAIDDLTRIGLRPSIQGVSDRLVMAHSNTCRAVDQAVEADLVAKQQSAEDGRRIELALTDKGARALAELNARRTAVHRELMQGWRGNELATLSALLEKLCDAYEDLVKR